MGAAGIIQADLARAAHVSEATISLIRRKGHIPSADIVRALAEALGADVDSALEAAGIVNRSHERD
jgi:transcriptional regulator with XRE-family HTH domain